MIGDPATRYREDPVRMLRAVRFAARLGFLLHPDTEAPIFELAGLLEDISPSRLFDETLKLFMSGYAVPTWELLRHYGLFGSLYPQTEDSLSIEDHGFPRVMLAHAMENTDLRIEQGKPVTPAFLYAALLWEPVRMRMEELLQGKDKIGAVTALQIAGSEVLSRQARSTSIPKRFSFPMREIWTLQPRFENRQGARALRLLTHPRFRAAYDFLLLRAECGEAEQESADWWTEFQTLEPAEQKARVQASGRRGRKRRPRKPRSEAGQAGEQGGDQGGNQDSSPE
jgi:poly(A) polymerase